MLACAARRSSDAEPQQTITSFTPASAAPVGSLPQQQHHHHQPQPRRFSAAAVYLRALVVVSLSQLLRCASFLSTQLPGPAAHCQPGSEAAALLMESEPGLRDVAAAFFAVDVRRQARFRCVCQKSLRFDALFSLRDAARVQPPACPATHTHTRLPTRTRYPHAHR